MSEDRQCLLVSSRKSERMSAGWISEYTEFQSEPETLCPFNSTHRNMRTLFNLLVILLTVHSVTPLKCYTCGSATSNEECNKNSEECQAPFDTCMTTVAKLGTVKGIVKSCTSSRVCTGASSIASVDNNGNGVQISCCTSRLCNYSGATSIKAHRWLMVLPLIIISLLTKQHT